jgi:hypothetical protein
MLPALLGSVEARCGRVDIYETWDPWERRPAADQALAAWKRCYVAVVSGRAVGLVTVFAEDGLPSKAAIWVREKASRDAAAWDGRGKEIQDVFVVEDCRGRWCDGPPLIDVVADVLEDRRLWDKISVCRSPEGRKWADRRRLGGPPAADGRGPTEDFEGTCLRALEEAEADICGVGSGEPLPASDRGSTSAE